MTDLETLKALLDKCPRTNYELSNRPISENTPFADEQHNNGHQVLRVLPGYRAHFEAVFDKDGNILSIGQWEDM